MEKSIRNISNWCRNNILEDKIVIAELAGYLRVQLGMDPKYTPRKGKKPFTGNSFLDELGVRDKFSKIDHFLDAIDKIYGDYNKGRAKQLAGVVRFYLMENNYNNIFLAHSRELTDKELKTITNTFKAESLIKYDGFYLVRF